MTSAATATPRRGIQLLVWLFAAVAVLGVAALTDLAAPGTNTAAASVSATTTQAVDTNVSAPVPEAPDQSALATTSGSLDMDTAVCNSGAGGTSFLPSMRWSDFTLSVFDDGFIVKANAMLSSFGSFMFFLGDVAWKVLFFFLNFGITFHPLCVTAQTINTVVADLGTLVSWFAIPAFLFFVFQKRREFAKLQLGRIIASAFLMMAFVGGVFYVTDTAKNAKDQNYTNEQVLATTGTMPWAANTMMNFFAGAYTSISGVSGIFNNSDNGSSVAFYDTKSTDEIKCNDYVNELYNRYEGAVSDKGSSSAQSAVMVQMSGIWEQAYLSSWMRAQFGPGAAGDKNQDLPAHVACRHLETTVSESNKTKWDVFTSAHSGIEGIDEWDFSAEGNPGTGLNHLMQPIGETFRLPVDTMWAQCQFRDGAWTTSPGVQEAERDGWIPCSSSPGGDQKVLPMGPEASGDFKALTEELSRDDTGIVFSKGEDSVKEHIGYANGDAGLNNYRDFVRNSVGGNIGDRIGQSLIAAVISVVYLWAFGPMSLGLAIVGFALIILLSLFPIALLLTALKFKGGTKMIAMTAGATSVLFVFGLVLSLLSTIISIFQTIVTGLVGGTGFASQILLAAAPIAAVLLLKKLLQSMGLGNITSLAGSLGLASAMAAKTAGQKGEANAVSNAAGRGMDAARRAGMSGARGLGAGINAMRKGGPSPLQQLADSRMGRSALGKKAIGAMQGAAAKARGAKNAVGSLAKDRAQSAKEEFAGTGMGRGLSAAGNKISQAADAVKGSAFGRGVGALAKSKTGRYGAALTATAGAGVAAGAFGAGAIPLAVAATGALPLSRALMARGKSPEQRRMERMERKGLATRDDDGNLVLKDDDGNDLKTARQLAYARSNGLFSKADVANKRIADRALRNMSPQEQDLYTENFRAAQIAGLPASDAHREAKKQALEARNLIGKLKTPEERDAALQAYTAMQMDTVRARQNGADSAGGMHPGFKGYDNEIVRQIGLETISAKLGVDKDQLVLGNHGLAVPAPTLATERQGNGAPALPDTASMELASHPALYLDKATVQRGANESDEQYSSRITATLAARGLIDDQGMAVDVFKASGIDVNTAGGEQRVQKWLDGGRDDILSGIEFSKVRGEDAVIKAGMKWDNDNTIDHAERQWAHMARSMQMHGNAMTDIADIGSITVAGRLDKVQLDDGTVPTMVGSLGRTPAVNVAMGPATGSSDAQRLNMTPGSSDSAPVEVKEVTARETLTNIGDRSQRMRSLIAAVDDKESEVPVQERVRTATRGMSEVEGMEREVTQMLDGLKAAAFARAEVSVNHFAASNPERATSTELRQISQRALEGATRDSEGRASEMSKHMSELWRAVRASQHAPDETVQRRALGEAAQKMKDVQEAMQALYDQEETASKEVAESAKAAFAKLNADLNSGTVSTSGPNRRVPPSTDYLAEMARMRKESVDA